jgi:hypothetical protein
MVNKNKADNKNIDKEKKNDTTGNVVKDNLYTKFSSKDAFNKEKSVIFIYF